MAGELCRWATWGMCGRCDAEPHDGIKRHCARCHEDVWCSLSEPFLIEVYCDSCQSEMIYATAISKATT